MNRLFKRLFVETGTFLGKAELTKLDFYASRAVKQQERNLRKLMKQNKNTVYGKLNNFKDVKSVKDYQDIVPYSHYSDYADYITRMAENGEKGLITNKLIYRYAESSGSTGQSKLVPMSAWALWVCQCFSFSAPVGCAFKYFKREKGTRLPPQRGLLTIEVLSHKLPCGRIAGGLAAHPMLFLKPITPFFVTSPREVMYPTNREPMDMHYMKLRFALPRRDVSYLGTVFVTMLESMMFYLENNWEILCDDIEKGTISDSIVCPPDIRKKLLKKLKPDPERAEELRREFRKGFDDEAIVPRIWPKVGWIYGMGTGSLSIYQQKLRRYIGSTPIHYLGYAASEGLMAVPIELDSYEYVMLPQNGFYEFLPIDAPEDSRPLTISELEVGKEYELILTNMSGFYRYRIEDVVKVTGFYKQSPMVTFMYRRNQIANISGEKINQHAFNLLIQELSEEVGEKFNGYCIYPDRSTSPGHYLLLIEPTNDVPDSECQRYAEIFERRLCETNVLVPPLLRNGALGHCEVKFLKANTYEDYREVLRAKGVNINQTKPVKVIDNEERKEYFFSHIRESLK